MKNSKTLVFTVFLSIIAIAGLAVNVYAKALVVTKKPIDSAEKAVPILVYHSIAPKTAKKEGKMQKQYHVFPENFEAQMQYLKDNGYTPISLATLDDHLINGTAIPNKSVVLTFDDGWKNQYEYAYPILKKFKFTGTFFIITGIVGKGGGYMTWDQIKDLQANGFDIESHSVTHPFLAKIKDSKKLEQELVDSKKTLEIKLGVPVTAIAYPYYNYNAIVEAAVKKAGYTAARAGWVKGINSKDSIYYLKSQESVNNQNPFSSIVAK